MKYKIGDTFMNQLEITAIDKDRTSQYFLSGCQGTGWWSEAALDDLRKMSCGDCKWKGERHQKCSCCIRNNNMKDNYEYQTEYKQTQKSTDTARERIKVWKG